MRGHRVAPKSRNASWLRLSAKNVVLEGGSRQQLSLELPLGTLPPPSAQACLPPPAGCFAHSYLSLLCGFGSPAFSAGHSPSGPSSAL